jgi:2-C-methyl-D-erythritol 4-phosphate cytidylyltransferase
VPLCAGAIVVAAGQGLRMGAACRKQYLELGGRPILAMTLQVLAESGCFGPLLAVVPPEELDFCRERILRPAGLERRVALAAGGAERQDSVYRGLLALPPVAVVAVHDGVRPLVGAAEIRACVAAAAQAGGAILALPVVETLKLVDDAGAIRRTLPRSRIYAAQTPQAFRTEILRAAHERARREGWRATDDAMLVERNGGRVTVLPGSRRNIKITTPEDLRLAQALLAAGWPGGGG